MAPPSSPLQAPPQLIRPAGLQPPPPPRDRPLAPRAQDRRQPRAAKYVSCGCAWHRGQFSVGCVSGVILCRYARRIGDLFVRSCVRSLLV